MRTGQPNRQLCMQNSTFPRLRCGVFSGACQRWWQCCLRTNQQLDMDPRKIRDWSAPRRLHVGPRLLPELGKRWFSKSRSPDCCLRCLPPPISARALSLSRSPTYARASQRCFTNEDEGCRGIMRDLSNRPRCDRGCGVCTMIEH